MYLKVRLPITIILMIKVKGLSLWTRTTSCKARIIEVDISAFWAVFLARVKLITSRDSSPFNNGLKFMRKPDTGNRFEYAH